MKNGRTLTVGNIPVFPTGIEALSRLENTIYEHRVTNIFRQSKLYILFPEIYIRWIIINFGQSSHLNFTVVHVLVCSNTLKI